MVLILQTICTYSTVGHISVGKARTLTCLVALDRMDVGESGGPLHHLLLILLTPKSGRSICHLSQLSVWHFLLLSRYRRTEVGISGWQYIIALRPIESRSCYRLSKRSM